MRIFNQEKTEELENPDLSLGYLKQEKLLVAHHGPQEEILRQSHYEVVAVYPNGGKDLQEVVDAEYRPAKEAWDEYEDILVYIPYTEEELIIHKRESIRQQREAECFSVVNRGELWYEKLTEAQRKELSAWYEAWLDAPKTGNVPEKPIWLDEVSKQSKVV